jgi:tetratricopeptide (TPR) repeat protein
VDLSGSKRTRLLICLGLAVVTLGLYWQVHGFDFVSFDDPDYVSENPMVTRGLTFSGIIWAFTHFYAGNWHPLTWISLMLDCQIFGAHPGGLHIMGVLFHTANSILLFLLLQRITGAQWRSAIVAAVFAVHPLHVESVAWISERKDVLSTFFGLLSLLAYANYVDKSKVHPPSLGSGATSSPKSKVWYAWAIVLFVLSLLSKPMLVTLPCVMLLLDFWPLQRMENSGWRTFSTRQFGALVKEKWPWFACAAFSCVITLFAQTSVIASAEAFPLKWRLFNAVDSYFWYIEKTFWPTKLAIFYPLTPALVVGSFIVALFCLVIITVAAATTVKRWPFLLVGWAWFIGTLVPVIGIVQVGSQATADRYGYIPMVGLLIALVWGAHRLCVGSTTMRISVRAAAATVIALLAAAAFLQIRYWKNSITLYTHALDVTSDNVTALNNLGVIFYNSGRNDDAVKMYQLALKIKPEAPNVHKNLGLVLAQKGDTNGALFQYQEAVRLNPADAALQSFLAETFVRLGRNGDALPHFSEAARLKPDNAQYQNDLAVALVTAGQRPEALPHYARAAQLEPSNAQYQNNFATALARAGDLKTAEEHYRLAIQDDPKFAESHSNLGALLLLRQQFMEAASHYSEAVRLSPTNAALRFSAGVAFLRMHRIEDAKAQFNEAARLRPDWTEPLAAEAWALATSSDDQARNGAEAVKLAEKAAELSSHQQPTILNTLAAAYAESGRFDDALATANQALLLAKQSNRTNLVPRIEKAITLYQAHKPVRENSAD